MPKIVERGSLGTHKRQTISSKVVSGKSKLKVEAIMPRKLKEGDAHATKIGDLCHLPLPNRFEQPRPKVFFFLSSRCGWELAMMLLWGWAGGWFCSFGPQLVLFVVNPWTEKLKKIEIPHLSLSQEAGSGLRFFFWSLKRGVPDFGQTHWSLACLLLTLNWGPELVKNMNVVLIAGRLLFTNGSCQFPGQTNSSHPFLMGDMTLFFKWQVDCPIGSGACTASAMAYASLDAGRRGAEARTTRLGSKGYPAGHKEHQSMRECQFVLLLISLVLLFLVCLLVLLLSMLFLLLLPLL